MLSVALVLVVIAVVAVCMRPLGAVVDYNEIARLNAITLPKYLGSKGQPYKLINEAASRDYVAGRLFRRANLKWEGGMELKFPIQFRRADVTQWGGPFSEIALKNTGAVTWGTVPWRFLEWGWFKAIHELHINRGAREVLIDLGKQCREDVSLDVCETLEETLFAEDGNYAHDGTGADHLIPFGLFYWVTIDGLPITGGAADLVAGINPTTYAAWQNPYINPVASADGLGTIDSIYQLRHALNRMMRLMKFDSIQTWGKLAEGVENAPRVDPDTAETPKDLMLLCDDRTEVNYREVLFDRQDNIGYDQSQARPTYKRLEIRGTDKLRMTAYGYGYDADGNALWTDRTGDYESGQWKNYGRTLVVNTKYFHVAVHPLHAPYQKKPYMPERRMGIAHEGDLWLQTICRSRRRGVGWIGPYNTDLVAA